MALSQISAPNKTNRLGVIGDMADGGCMLIDGVGYSVNAGVIAYAQGAGYQVTAVGSVPASYTVNVAKVQAMVSKNTGGAALDASDLLGSADRQPHPNGTNTVTMTSVVGARP